MVLYRHPGGFVASVTRLGWPTAVCLQDFQTRSELMEAHLSAFAGLMDRHARADSIESAAVLHGVLNIVLWSHVQQYKLRWHRFEDLCVSPLDAFREIFAWLDLPYSESEH